MRSTSDEAMAVGGDHADARTLGDDLEVDAVQVVTRLVERGGVDGSLDHLREHRGLEAHHPARRELGQARVLLGVRAGEREAGATAAKIEVAVRRGLELDRLVGKLAHDVVELPRGDGERARLRDLRGLRAANADLEVGCRELEPAVLALAARGGEHVGEDRHRAALLDDGLETCETALEIGLLDGELHGFTSSRSSTKW